MNYLLALIILIVVIYTTIKLLKRRKPLPKDRWGRTASDYEGFQKKVKATDSKQAFKELRDSAKKLDNYE